MIATRSAVDGSTATATPTSITPSRTTIAVSRSDGRTTVSGAMIARSTQQTATMANAASAGDRAPDGSSSCTSSSGIARKAPVTPHAGRCSAASTNSTATSTSGTAIGWSAYAASAAPVPTTIPAPATTSGHASDTRGTEAAPSLAGTTDSLEPRRAAPHGAGRTRSSGADRQPDAHPAVPQPGHASEPAPEVPTAIDPYPHRAPRRTARDPQAEPAPRRPGAGGEHRPVTLPHVEPHGPVAHGAAAHGAAAPRPD